MTAPDEGTGTWGGLAAKGTGAKAAADGHGTGNRSLATVRRAEPVVGTPSRSRRAQPRKLTWRVAIFVLLMLAVLAVSAGSVAWYARSAYFVGLAGDQVAIFKGRPGGILWFEPTLVERKPLRVDEILPAKIDELRAGKEEPSKADADRYVNNLRLEAAQRRGETPASTTPTTTGTGQP